MMTIANKPLLQYQLELLRSHGIKHIIFSISTSDDKIQHHFGDGSNFDIQIDYAVETTPLGTGGAIRNALQFVKCDTILAINGDGLINYDLSSLIQFHQSVLADATIGLMAISRPTPCGIITTDSNSRIISFDEPDIQVKKMLGTDTAAIGTATVNAGVYVVSKSALMRIPEQINYSIEREFFPSIISEGLGVFGHQLSGYGVDIGAPAQYIQAHHALLSGKLKAGMPGVITSEGYWLEPGAQIEPSAQISIGSYIGAGSKIGQGVKITNYSSIGPGTTIGDNSTIGGSVVLENVTIGSGCVLDNSIVDRDSTLGDGVTLCCGSIISAGSRIF
jgi:NDP-sugar pyrophosphorylase family protein